MLLPYNVDVPLERRPWANWLLIAVTLPISLFILIENRTTREIEAVVLRGEKLTQERVEALRREVHDPPPLPLSLRQNGPILGYVSHVFVHDNLFRLAANLIFLFCFGNAVNARLGHIAFLFVYFLLGAVSGRAELWLGATKVVHGAAGAVMGIMGVFAVLFPRNDVRVLFWMGAGWRGTFALSSYWIVLACVLADVLAAAFGEGRRGYVGHLIGAAAGGLLAVLLLAGGLVKPRPGEENLLQLLGLQAREDVHP